MTDIKVNGSSSGNGDHTLATNPPADATEPDVAEDEELDEAAQEEAQEKLRREREARAQALTLEIVGDLPYAEVKPPENVLFVCKLNPVTEGQGPAFRTGYRRLIPAQTRIWI